MPTTSFPVHGNYLMLSLAEATVADAMPGILSTLDIAGALVWREAQLSGVSP